MKYRKDINGLRAVAVIAVVLFHFNPEIMPGGFAGVDVFFVISGFLMTGIIVKGLLSNNFSVLGFYAARASRIIPALSFLCAVLLFLGYFFLTPLDLKELGNHVVSSLGFISNFIYWRESGYFDSASHTKWLLHTWSLSVEWQFYILYPIMLMVIKKVFGFNSIRYIVLVGTLIGFLFCVAASYKWATGSYYLLPTRAWEMMVGGVAYLYPFKLGERQKKVVEYLGLSMVVFSYIFHSKFNLWPGYLAAIPVVGAFLIIQAHRENSVFTGNRVFQAIGSWSYSVYLWHWPIVVAIYYFSADEIYVYGGIALSILLGCLSKKYIENIRFKDRNSDDFRSLKHQPYHIAIVIGAIGCVFYYSNGFLSYATPSYRNVVESIVSSPYRDTCHIGSYNKPSKACEYIGDQVSWATFGDSHTVEIAYVLAKKLSQENIGLKHFSFSGCKPSYEQVDSYSKCSKWYNEAVDYIISDSRIRNVVFNHRFTAMVLGGDANNYPVANTPDNIITSDVRSVIAQTDKLINLFASTKDNVYVFYPIPELPRDIAKLVGENYLTDQDILNIVGTDTKWYEARNNYFINHFDSTEYPDNVHFINPKDVFCDKDNCYAVKDGVALYFDDDHPSLAGAEKLINLMGL